MKNILESNHDMVQYKTIQSLAHISRSLLTNWEKRSLSLSSWMSYVAYFVNTKSDKSFTFQIAMFMGPTLGPPGSWRPQVGPMLALWILLSGFCSSCCALLCHIICIYTVDMVSSTYPYNAALTNRWSGTSSMLHKVEIQFYYELFYIFVPL